MSFFRVPALAIWVLLAGYPAVGLELKAIAQTDIDILDNNYVAIGTVPEGSEVTVVLCLTDATKCYVDFGGSEVLVDSVALLVEGSQGVSAQEADEDFLTSLLPVAPVEIGSIIAWGDSLTSGAGATSGGDYPSKAGALLGEVVNNGGIGGQTSTQIAVRQGAVPLDLVLDDGQVAGIGNTRVQSYSIDVLTRSGKNVGSLAGSIEGVAGSLETDPDGNYTFVRTMAGDAAPCSPCLFVPVVDDAATDWLWVGQNGASANHDVEADIEAMVKQIGDDRYLVGGVTAGMSKGPAAIKRRTAMNDRLRQRYGEHYVDVPAALAAAASDDPEDQAAAELGAVPPSLQSDNVHLNDQGYAAVAEAFVESQRQLSKALVAQNAGSLRPTGRKGAGATPNPSTQSKASYFPR